MARDPWDDVMEQLRQALADQVEDAATREALLEGLGEGLGAAFEQLGLTPDTPPEVQLVEGGHQDDDPTSEVPRPELRVLRPEDAPVADAPDEETPPVAPLVTSVRVIKAGEKLGNDGVIHVQPEQWQTVFRGAEPRPYRLVCSRGVLRVALDGVPADRLEAGQSMDIEARLLRVSAEGEAPARGHYTRL